MYTWPLGNDKSSTEGAIQFVCSLVHPIPTGINDGAWTTVQSFFGAVVPPFLKSYRDCFYVYHAFRGKGTTTYATRSFVDFQFIFCCFLPAMASRSIGISCVVGRRDGKHETSCHASDDQSKAPEYEHCTLFNQSNPRSRIDSISNWCVQLLF